MFSLEFVEYVKRGGSSSSVGLNRASVSNLRRRIYRLRHRAALKWPIGARFAIGVTGLCRSHLFGLK